MPFFAGLLGRRRRGITMDHNEKKDAGEKKRNNSLELNINPLCNGRQTGTRSTVVSESARVKVN